MATHMRLLVTGGQWGAVCAYACVGEHKECYQLSIYYDIVLTELNKAVRQYEHITHMA